MPTGPAVDACLCSIVQSMSGATLLIMVTAVDQEISRGSKMVCVGLGGLMMATGILV